MLNIHEKEVIVMHRPAARVPFEQPHSIPVVQGPTLRSGVSTAVGFMPAGVLIPNRYSIPYYDTRTKKGYQRPPQEARINQLANDLRKDRTDLPTAVLLNLRARDADEALAHNGLVLDPPGVGDPAKFYVVDGQHRILALEKLVREDPTLWTQFMIPFVCLLGASEEDEMEQFYIVNSTAKSVKTDLALALLRRRADADPDVLEALQERGRDWQVLGQAIVEKLSSESSIWKHLVRLPGMEKGETTIPSASFVMSLKAILASPYFAVLKVEQQIKVLDAFWHGIREILRPAFDDPTAFVIQKGVGVTAMHTILPQVVEIIRSKGASTADADAYRDVLKSPLLRLEGDDGDGNPVNGLEFWAVSPKGAAGSYSSSAGRRVLAAKLRQLLPTVDVE
jgi:DGQHR domain-containing protein